MFVGKNATVGSTDFTVIRGNFSNHDAVIQGTVIGHGVGIDLGFALTASSNSVTIAEGAYVQSSVTTAVAVRGLFGHIVNHGVIVGGATGVILGGFSDDPDPTLSRSTLENTGRIDAGIGIYRADGSNRMIEVHNSGVISALIAYRGDSGDGIDHIFNTGRIEGSIDLGSGDDLYDGRSGVITGSVDGGDGNDTIVCGRGDDTLLGGTGADSMRGGAGNDFYVVDNSGDRVIESNAASGGEDTIVSTISINLNDKTMVKGAVEAVGLGAPGNLSATGNALNNLIVGFTDNNVLRGGGGNDTIYGQAGKDRLLGQGGNDLLRGGAGADTLEGGAGNDRLFGEGGADRFVFAPGGGTDRIKDFQDGTDRIDLTAFGFANVQAARALAADQQGNVVFDFDGDGTLIVENVTKAQLTAADLII